MLQSEFGRKGRTVSNRTKGIACIILSAFCFTMMNIGIRLSGDLPSVQKSFFRNLVAMLIALVVVLRDRSNFQLNKGDGKWLMLRSVAGTVGILCNFYAVDHLVLADATMLNKMSPFFAVIFAVVLLKERLKLPQVLLILGAFLGSMLIVKPTFSNLALGPSLLGLLGGIGAGLAYAAVRVMSKRGVHKPLIVLVFSTFSCLVVIPYLVLHAEPMSARQFGFLILTGAAAAGGQFAVTAAYSYAPPREISVFDYSQILFAAIFGYFLFDQVPDWYSVIGYITICTMAILMLLYNRREDRLVAQKES